MLHRLGELAACRLGALHDRADCLQESLTVRDRVAVHKDVWDARVHSVVVGFNSLLAEQYSSQVAVHAGHDLVIVDSSTARAFKGRVLLAVVLAQEAHDEVCADASHVAVSGVAGHVQGTGLDEVSEALVLAVLACDVLLEADVEALCKELWFSMTIAAGVPALANIDVVFARSLAGAQLWRRCLRVSVAPSEEAHGAPLEHASGLHQLLEVLVGKINAVGAQ